MASLSLLGADYMAGRESNCTAHRWDKWQEPMVMYIRNEKGDADNVLTQYRQCVECGLAESRKVL